MVDKDLYIQQLTYKIRKQEIKLKELHASNSKLVLENTIYTDEIEKLYTYLRQHKLLDSYNSFKENNYVSNHWFSTM